MIVVMREDRKEQIIDKAIGIFAEWGYYKTTTAQVAKAVGVTQPYVFHFFKNKEELFKAVIDRAILRIFDAFAEVKTSDEQLMDEMGEAFMQLLHTHRDEIIMVMQAHAIAEPMIRVHVREKFRMLYTFLAEKMKQAGNPNADEEASHFMGMGLLITLAEVLDLPELMQFKKIESHP